jgi:lipopolysaccharide biosynthesis glycosyltransferase
VEGPPLLVFTAGDGGYLRYVAGLVASLGSCRDLSRPVHLTVIHRGIRPERRREVEQLMPAPHRVAFDEVSPSRLKALGASPHLARLTPHYFRLLIPYLAPRTARRAIYLDADTVVLKDIAPLEAIDLRGFPVAAMQDFISCIGDAVANWQQLGLNPDAPYLNSGVLVIDLQRWREERIAERVIEICRANPDYLAVQGKWHQFDQYGLNVLLQGRWRPIPRCWNHPTFEPPKRDMKIIHFIGDGKLEATKCHDAHRAVHRALLVGTPFETIAVEER